VEFTFSIEDRENRELLQLSNTGAGK